MKKLNPTELANLSEQLQATHIQRIADMMLNSDNVTEYVDTDALAESADAQVQQVNDLIYMSFPQKKYRTSQPFYLFTFLIGSEEFLQAQYLFHTRIKIERLARIALKFQAIKYLLTHNFYEDFLDLAEYTSYWEAFKEMMSIPSRHAYLIVPMHPALALIQADPDTFFLLHYSNETEHYQMFEESEYQANLYSKY